jgi:hypothetical protein
MVSPADFPFHTVEAGIVIATLGYMHNLFKSLDPIAPNRKLIRWALGNEKVQEARGSLLAAASAGEASTDDDRREIINTRLSYLREDAWARKRHLCIDRALWKKGAREVTHAAEGAGGKDYPSMRA